ncbi:hypothetical protein L1987_12384 [Smallanthus sonchifolius]|uniref:Uncharacterized protein n=1 Tax=Smallanthus sonchifolius TaxID=185202 RepID=A0ACB9JE04_9ASTR|nr:hypothetical protein L1987_12384 [Smallanthus sonchifolius]
MAEPHSPKTKFTPLFLKVILQKFHKRHFHSNRLQSDQITYLVSLGFSDSSLPPRTQKNMETHVDFLEWLEPDMALKILACLDDSADLVRASAVSRYWQNTVVSNGLSKQLCMRTFPQLASITRVVEPSHDNSGERDHRAYASLFRALTAFPLTCCIADAVSASSTDHYPAEGVMNTLYPIESIVHRRSYWSSKGTDDPETHETLIYRLTSSFCVVREINLHPFQVIKNCLFVCVNVVILQTALSFLDLHFHRTLVQPKHRLSYSRVPFDRFVVPPTTQKVIDPDRLWSNGAVSVILSMM